MFFILSQSSSPIKKIELECEPIRFGNGESDSETPPSIWGGMIRENSK